MLYTSEDVASARETLGNLWPMLRPGLWHMTVPARFPAILAAGEIKPDGGKQGNVYQGSFAKSVGAVSLFDFESASEEDALGTFQKWSAHLRAPDARLTVWIGLCRDRLPGHLILADEVRKRAVGKLWYPRIEACHVGPIPADAFAAVLAVSTAGPQQCEALAINEAALPRLRELAEQWPDPETPLVRRLRAGRGPSTHRAGQGRAADQGGGQRRARLTTRSTS
jgi:hypothetical protein